MLPSVPDAILLEPLDLYRLLRFILQHLRFDSIISVYTAPNYLPFARILNSFQQSSVHLPLHKSSLGRVTRQVLLGSSTGDFQPYYPHCHFYVDYDNGSHVCLCCAAVASWWNHPFPSRLPKSSYFTNLIRGRYFD